MTESVFAHFEHKLFPHRFDGTLTVGHIAGGIPSDPNKAEGWLRTKLNTTDDLLASQVIETMVERNLDEAAAIEHVAKLKTLNGFKRHDTHGLYIEGRQLKAAVKEAGMVAVGAGNLKPKGWGTTNKWTKAFLAEHVFVENERLYLHRADGAAVHEPDQIVQRFVHVRGVSGIQYEEVVDDAWIDFTVSTDWEFTEEQWAAIWLSGERQGIGASRSQGFGTYKVTRWAAS